MKIILIDNYNSALSSMNALMLNIANGVVAQQ